MDCLPACDWWSIVWLYWLIYWLVNSLVDWLTDWLTGLDSLPAWLTDWPADYVSNLLINWLSDWLSYWLTDGLSEWLIKCWRPSFERIVITLIDWLMAEESWKNLQADAQLNRLTDNHVSEKERLKDRQRQTDRQAEHLRQTDRQNSLIGKLNYIVDFNSSFTESLHLFMRSWYSTNISNTVKLL